MTEQSSKPDEEKEQSTSQTTNVPEATSTKIAAMTRDLTPTATSTRTFSHVESANGKKS